MPATLRFVLSAYAKLLIFDSPTSPSARRHVNLCAPIPPPPHTRTHQQQAAVACGVYHVFCPSATFTHACDALRREGARLQPSATDECVFVVVPTEGNQVAMR